MLPRFEAVRRLRPVSLLATGAEADYEPGSVHPCPQPAPSIAVVVDLESGHRATAALHLAGMRLAMSLADGHISLQVPHAHGTRRLRSRRHGRVEAPPTRAAITLTGTHLTALSEEEGRWVARARFDLSDVIDTRDPAVLATLQIEGHGQRVQAGPFGQLGLRDLRLVTERDGTPVRDGARVLLSATSAGPGFFDTAHTSVWALDPELLEMEHLSDIFFHRPDKSGVYGDHATHIVRESNSWLVATSTWGDFAQSDALRSVRVTLAHTDADLLRGAHVLGTTELPLPTDGFTSVGVWDPHLVHTGEEWLVGYVSARKFFRFHPVLAAGPSLKRLELRGAATDRRATEGTTVLRVDNEWRVLASDGRGGHRGQRSRFPVFDLTLNEVGQLDAAYPTNLPWPTLLRTADGWLMIAFNGRPATGPLVGYGTHGDVVIMRSTIR